MNINAKIKMAFFLVFASLGSPSVSAEDDLPYPPTYFSKFRIDLAVAQDVAENCKGIEIDREVFSQLAEEQMQMLEQDGFTREKWRSEMQDIPVGLRDRPRTEFYMKWGVSKSDAQSYCNAGQMEMLSGSSIGTLLMNTE